MWEFPPDRNLPSHYLRSKRVLEVCAGMRNSSLQKIPLRLWNHPRPRRTQFHPPGGAHVPREAPAEPAPRRAETSRNIERPPPSQRHAGIAYQLTKTAEEYSTGECPSAKASAGRRNSDRPWLPPL